MGFIHLQIEWNPWLGVYHPHIPILFAHNPQLNLLNPLPPQKKFLGTPLAKWFFLFISMPHYKVIQLALHNVNFTSVFCSLSLLLFTCSHKWIYRSYFPLLCLCVRASACLCLWESERKVHLLCSVYVCVFVCVCVVCVCVCVCRRTCNMEVM
jgi:hypothetical protein